MIPHHTISSYPHPNTVLAGSCRKTRFALPKGIAHDKKLVYELREHIEKALIQRKCHFLSVQVTRSKPLRIKLTGLPDDKADWGSDARRATEQTCKGLYRLVDDIGLSPDLAVKLAGSSLDWESIDRGLQTLLYGGNSFDEAMLMAEAFGALATALTHLVGADPGAAKGLIVLIDLLEKVPEKVRNLVIHHAFSLHQPWTLDMVLQQLAKTGDTRFQCMLAQAQQACSTEPGST